ncbi:MAG: phosphoribosyltransferase [Verrucomicrobiota bacterium]
MLFTDRAQAGRFLASKLLDYKEEENVIILALPRGGVPVAHEVAQILNLPWDILVVRKIGLPGHRELGIGVIASGGVEQISENLSSRFGISSETVSEVINEERDELKKREHRYRDGYPFPDVQGKTVILIDDGLATGSAMRAAIQTSQCHGALRVIVAVPIGSIAACRFLRNFTDDTVCAYIPEYWEDVGSFYLDFHQYSDSEIESLLCDSEVGPLFQDSPIKKHQTIDL